jgi:mono/diheme cytochrome c family protein
MFKRFLMATSIAALAVVYASSQESKLTVPLTPTQPVNGKQMYVNYCAPCHGLDGRGGGPRAIAWKIAPTDLTQLSKNNHGVYPDVHIVAVLKFGSDNRDHGSKAMPVWGPSLLMVDHPAGGGTPNLQALRISNLVAYIQTLQTK